MSHRLNLSLIPLEGEMGAARRIEVMEADNKVLAVTLRALADQLDPPVQINWTEITDGDGNVISKTGVQDTPHVEETGAGT